jgi:hypothetical protein
LFGTLGLVAGLVILNRHRLTSSHFSVGTSRRLRDLQRGLYFKESREDVDYAGEGQEGDEERTSFLHYDSKEDMFVLN